MNNLKKTVAIVIALAMVLSMGVTSFAAFSDVPSTVNYAEAVNVLANLGIINGYDDGTFRPDNTITRAEVATIVVNTLGLGETKGATVFSDVPADHWAAGYINTAYGAGIISGMGDGTFAPGANVTYEQVVRMIVSALQYDMAANQAGGYPTGYLSIASRYGISQGAVGTVGTPATRATVARLIYNALEVPMLDVSEWGWTVDNNRYSQNKNVTLLSNLGVEKLEVIVTDTYLNKDTYNSRDNQITLAANAKYNADDYKNSNYIDEDYTRGKVFSTTFAEGGTAAASLLGYACVAYVGEDRDTGEDTIFAITAKGNRNSVVTVKGDMFADDEASKADRIYYWKTSRSDNRPATLNLDEDVKIYENYLFTDNVELIAPKGDLTAAYAEYFADKGGIARFVDNDGDGEYEYVFLNTYTDEVVLDEIDEYNGVWSFEPMNDGNIDDYDEEDDSVLKLFIKDENYINVSELAPGDTVTAIECDNGITLYYVSSVVVEGTTRGYRSEDQTVSINNVYYGVSPINKLDIQAVRNKEGAFYINADGLISYYDASATVGGNFGYVTWVGETSSYNSTTYQIQLVDAQGVTQVYDLASSVRYYNEGTGSEKLDDSVLADENDGIFTQFVAEAPENRVIRYTLSGNTISRIVTNGSDEFGLNSVRSDRAYDAEDMAIGGVTFNNATMVFSVNAEEDDDYGDPKNVTVGNVSRFFVDGNTYEAYAYGDDDILAVLVVNPSTAIDLSGNVFVVSSTEIDYIDDEIAIIVTGYTNGRQETFTLYSPDKDVTDEYYNDDDTSSLVKGTVLMKGETVGQYVEDIDVIVLTHADNNNLVAEEPELVGEDGFKDNRNNVVQGITSIDKKLTSDAASGRVVFDKYLYDAEEGRSYAPHSSTTITVVDASKSLRLSRVTVGRGNASSLHIKSNADTYGYVFFRAYDVSSANIDEFDIQDERSSVKDIVLYLFNEDEVGSAPSTKEAVKSSSKVQSYDDEDEVIDSIVDDVDDEVVAGDDEIIIDEIL